LQLYENILQNVVNVICKTTFLIDAPRYAASVHQRINIFTVWYRWNSCWNSM